MTDKEEPNLLEIKLKDTDSVPEVYYKCDATDKRSDLVATNNQRGLLNYVRSPFFNDKQWSGYRW